MVFGLELIDPLLDSATKKLSFVSIWFSFAFALFLLNREHKRKTFINDWESEKLECSSVNSNSRVYRWKF